jgi:hypothetical protein
MLADRKAAKQFTNAGDIQSGVAPPLLAGRSGPQRKQGNGMRGIVAFAIMTAILAVIDAAFFKGKYLKDSQDAITGLASISTQIGRR